MRRLLNYICDFVVIFTIPIIYGIMWIKQGKYFSMALLEGALFNANESHLEMAGVMTIVDTLILMLYLCIGVVIYISSMYLAISSHLSVESSLIAKWISIIIAVTGIATVVITYIMSKVHSILDFKMMAVYFALLFCVHIFNMIINRRV